MKEHKVRRLITIFERDSEDFVDSVYLTNEEFESIRLWLDYDQSHPMYDCYPITNSALTKTKHLLGDRLPEGRFEYLLEAEAC